MTIAPAVTAATAADRAGAFDLEIQTVRKRWRTKLLLRGGIVVLGGALLALALASWGLQALRFSPAAVIGFRIAIFATFAILVALWFVRPLRRRVSDVQVALFVEEHEPSLQAAILSAVDAGASPIAGKNASARATTSAGARWLR